MSEEQSEIERLRAENARLASLFRTRCEQSDACRRNAVADDESAAAAAASSSAFGDENASVAIVILGASGDLALKKLFPAVFGLHANGLLPRNVLVAGYARSELAVDAFRARVAAKLPAGATADAFVARLQYFHGAYDDAAAAAALSRKLFDAAAALKLPSAKQHRLFYASLPPSAFVGAVQALHDGCVPAPGGGWTRVVVEKPFGHDLDSARKLQCEIASLFDEAHIFRIDHYLAKQMVMNLLALRFANAVFSPLWCREWVRVVQITFKEDIGTEGRGAYFDQAGIIRDVLQNHLVQVLALVAMEPPVSLSADDIRDEKVKVLRAIPPILLKDLVVGQYEGYRGEPGVAQSSTTPTYACARLFVNNPRWEGVPFVLKAGKGLNERKAEIRIQFRTGAAAKFLFPGSALPNELVIRIQPREAIYLKMMSKTPGLNKSEITQAELDLSFSSRFEAGAKMPEAYELLLRDALLGDHSLFVRSDELDASWRAFTPVLHELESSRVEPILYKRGVRGIPEGDKIATDSGYIVSPSEAYKWPRA